MRKQAAVFYLLCILVGCTTYPKEDKFSLDKVDVNLIIPDTYLIGPSDKLEIQYYLNLRSADDNYLIDAEDKLKIDFHYYPKLSKTVTVRPDGFITLSQIGDVKAAGETPTVLAKKISNLFAKQLKRPMVTVELIKFNAKIEKIKEDISSGNLGQAKHIIVRPDGRISLPYLQNDVLAAGKTTTELSKDLEEQYRNQIKNLGVITSVLEPNSYQAHIIGEVEKSGSYTLKSPTTLMQFIARAGGFTKDANIEQILIIKRDIDAKPHVTIVDLQSILKQKTANLPMIQQYDVIYIPATWLSDAALTADAIWRLIPIRLAGTVYQVD